MSPAGGGSRPGALRPGSRLGAYRIERLLGRGGMGSVYLTRHEQTGAAHALKVIHGGGPRREGDRILARFRREAEVMARVAGHPNIVAVHAVGVDQGVPWCAMQYVEGESLAARLARGRLPAREAAATVLTVARAIEHAHRHGVIHRDLKPENVLIDAGGRPRVVDFGIAYDVFAEQLTMTGELVGTPSYMAPELLAKQSREETGAAVDVYGLGALLYAALTARPPFEGDPAGVLMKVMRDEPEAIGRRAPDAPAELASICARAMAKSPTDRYATAGAFADDLDRWTDGEAVHAHAVGDRARRVASRWTRRRGLIAGAAVLAAAVVAAGAAIGIGGGSPFGTTPRAQVDAAASALARTGRLGEADAAALRRLLDTEGALDAERARRALAVLRTGELVAGDAPGGADDELARALRPDGVIDRALLATVLDALREARRWAAIDRVLHGADPVAGAPPLVAAGLARWMAGAEGASPPPAAEDAFEALLRAPGLDDRVRGRLLARRADGLMQREPPDADGALDALLRARALGVGPAGPWPPALVELAYARFCERIEAGEDARALGDLLVRADGVERPLPVPLAVRLQRAGGLTDVLGAGGAEPDARTVERVLAVSAVLMPRFGSPFHPSRVPVLQPVPPERLLARLEAEIAREPERRCPARLLFLAHVLERGEQTAELIGRAVAAARATGLERGWLDFHAGHLLFLAGETERGFALLQSAYAQQRRLPDERRAIVVLDRLALALQARSAAPTERVVAIALEAVRAQRAAEARSQALRAAGGLPPWSRYRYEQIVTVLGRAAADLLERETCCGASGVEALVGEALALLDRPEAALSRVFDAGQFDLHPWDLLGVRARHHIKHGRGEQALADLDAAIEQASAPEAAPSEQWRDDHLRKRVAFHEARANVRERLGRAEEARKDRERAAALRARMR